MTKNPSEISDLNASLKEYINGPAPDDARVAGEHFSGTLSEYYLALYENWFALKTQWTTDVQVQKDNHSQEQFLQWYEEHADGRLAIVDAAMGHLVAVFSPSDMEAIVGAFEGETVDESVDLLQTFKNVLKAEA